MASFRLAAAITSALVALTASAQALELRMLSSWDDTFPPTITMAKAYAKNVEAASKGDIKFVFSGPETVPPFEQLQPVGTGVFQLLFSNGAYHFAITPYLLAADTVKGDSKKWREVGFYDLIDKHYARQGLKVLFLAKSPPHRGYQIILRNPVGPSGDLSGRKIRGTQIYGGVLKSLNAAPVVLPPGEIYTALEKGVIDGSSWPSIGVADARWYEAAKYLLRPTFGHATHFMLMNLNAWNKLTDAQKEIMTDEALKIEEASPAGWEELTRNEEKLLLSKGMTITEMSPASAKKAYDGYEEGLLEMARTKNPAAVDEIRDFAKKNGL